MRYNRRMIDFLPKTTRFYVVRHGQAESNAQKVMGGHTDYLLTEEGRRQAFEKSKQFEHLTFHGVHSSDLARALHTAKLITHDKHEVRQHKELRERYYGKYEGMPYHVFEKEVGHLYSLRAKLHRHMQFYHKIHEDIESDMELAERMVGTLHKLQGMYRAGNVLVVAHGGIMRATLLRLGFVSRAGQLPSGSVKNVAHFVVESDGTRFKVVDHDGIEVQQ